MNALESIKEFFSFLFTYSRANVRKRRLMALEKICLKACNTDCKKRWIILGQGSKYEVLSTADLEYNKKKKIIKNNIYGKNLDEIADSIIVWSSKHRQAKIIRKTKEFDEPVKRS